MRHLRLAAPLIAGLAAFAAGPATAASISFALNFEFSGGTAPAGSAPWATITIDDAADAAGANGVRVTITNNLVSQEFISEFSLNLNPALDPTQLTFSGVNIAAVAGVSFLTGVDAFQADGDGKFDVLIDLPPPPGSFAAKYTAGETLVFDLVYTAALSASDFDFGSAPGGGNGTFDAAAHVQGIGPGADLSGWIGPVPEPGLAALVALGLAGVAWRKAAR